MMGPWFEITPVLFKIMSSEATFLSSYMLPPFVPRKSEPWAKVSGVWQRGKETDYSTGLLNSPSLEYKIPEQRFDSLSSPPCYHTVPDTLISEWTNKPEFEYTSAMWPWENLACFTNWDLGSTLHRQAWGGVFPGWEGVNELLPVKGQTHTYRWMLGASYV